MTIGLSTPLSNSLASDPKSKREFISSTISFGDGDGTGGRDTINDASGGLDIFVKGSFLLLLPPEPNPDRNKVVKVLSSSSTKLEVAAGTLTAMATGTLFTIQEPDIAGSFSSIFRNCTIHLFKEYRAANADLAEPGTPVCKITLNGADFTPGQPENGLNFGDIVDSILRRAIDPETGNTEIWTGDPLQEATVNSYICYANDVITGASIASYRFNGSVTGPNGGGDMTLDPTNSISVGTPVNIGTVRVELKATALL